MEATGCPQVIFNIPTTSGVYSQMSGVLAGFTFASIVLLLTHKQHRDRWGHMAVAARSCRNGYNGETHGGVSEAAAQARNKGILVAFATAFFIFTTTMLTYGVLAGEPLPGALGRAATEELLDGVPLAFAAMMLFHGMTLLIEKADISKVAVWLSRAMAAIAVPGLAMWYLSNAVADTVTASLAERAPHGACPGTASVPTFGLALTVPLLVILGLLLAIGHRHRARSMRARIQRLEPAVPVMCVAISIGVAFLSGFVSTRIGDFVMASWTLYLYLVITFTVLLSAGAIAAVSSGSEPVFAAGSPTTPELLTFQSASPEEPVEPAPSNRSLNVRTIWRKAIPSLNRKSSVQG